MKDPIAYSISTQLLKLKKKISAFNKKGDLIGLFSYHILSDSSDIGFNWLVICNDKEWLENNFKKDNLYNISSLGYSLHMNKNGYQDATKCFQESLEILSKRNHFDGSHMTFPYQPVSFLGLVLGSKVIKNTNQKKNYNEWLFSILKERKKRGKISKFHNIFYNYIEAQLENKPITVSGIRDFTSLEEISFIEWGITKNYFKELDTTMSHMKIREKVLHLLIKTDISQIDPEQAALILSASNNSISGGIQKIIKSPKQLSKLLISFESAMKRWRYDDESIKDPIKWPIKNEKEVQDIIWLMLRPYFNDLIDEESLPKLAHSSYKPDFAIPSLRILLEVKYIRLKKDFKKVEKEILEDSVGYLTKTTDYDNIFVFIYDHSCSVQEHDETRRDLKKVRGIEDVIIVSRPSQLPS